MASEHFEALDLSFSISSPIGYFPLQNSLLNQNPIQLLSSTENIVAFEDHQTSSDLNFSHQVNSNFIQSNDHLPPYSEQQISRRELYCIFFNCGAQPAFNKTEEFAKKVILLRFPSGNNLFGGSFSSQKR
jgi:hypothetical protein